MTRTSILLVLLVATISVGAEPKKAAKAKLAEPTVITAKSLKFDYKRSMATFEGDVVVVDPEVRMEDDKLNVVFGQTNELKAVTATGDVRLWHEDKLASCRRAIYMARTGEVILQGDAKVARGTDVVAGNEITFWLHEDRMICKPGHVIFYPAKRELPKPGKKKLPQPGKSRAGVEG